MNNSNLEKPTKSTIWIVATIWANIIIIAIIAGAGSFFLSTLLRLLFPDLINPAIVGYLIMFLIWAATIYAIRLGVKSVLKKSIIKKERIFKISLGVGLVYLFLKLASRF